MNSRWNRVASTLRSTVISTSGFGGRHFELVPQHPKMADNVDSVITKSGLIENIGVAVEIALLSQAVQKLLPLPFLWPPSWISRRRRHRIFLGAGTIEKPLPENGWWG